MNVSLDKSFDSESSFYDATTKYLLLRYDNLLNQVVEKINFKKNDSFYLLEIGCGTGNLTKLLRKKFPNAIIYALDFSENMIKEAKKKEISGVNYVFSDLFDLEKKNLPLFDVVVATYVFHNFRSDEMHIKAMSLLSKHLSVNGQFIYGDLIKKENANFIQAHDKKLVNQMIKYGLDDSKIRTWIDILHNEDRPLTIKQNLQMLIEGGFVECSATELRGADSAVFSSFKKNDSLSVKFELLIQGVRFTEEAKTVYLLQNPQNVWKTGNNGIFLTVGGLDTLVGINHKTNKSSPFVLRRKDSGEYVLLKHRKPINLQIEVMSIPDWFYTPIQQLGGEPFSSYFVYEGRGFLHLAYKGCSFKKNEKCKFCATKRRVGKTDHDAKSLCIAMKEVLPLVSDNIQMCLGGGTYIPFSQNVDFFIEIIKCARDIKPEMPIWVETIPPELEDIKRLVDAGATSFGFNIEIWDEDVRRKVCPGKSRKTKEQYIESLKYASKLLGPNKVGSCIIVGIDSYDSIKNAIDTLVELGVEPCVLVYKKYDKTEDISLFNRNTYYRDFLKLSEYAAVTSLNNNIDFNQNQGCLKCNCCTIMHDFQDYKQLEEKNENSGIRENRI